MGSYCNYKLDDWELETSKSYVIPELAEVFHEMDKRVNFITEDGEKLRKIKYVTNAKNARMRLDALGYTKKIAGKILLENREVWLKENSYLLPRNNRTLRKTYLESSIDDWIEAYKEIREKGFRAKYGDWDQSWEKQKYSSLVTIALGTDDSFYGIPLEHPYVLRLFLETCPNNTLVSLDVSEVVDAGYYRAREKICGDLNFGKKIIILTEGSTDKEFLENSLGILFPHMLDCYTFVDFSTFSVPGGVDKISHFVKTFSGVGIQNKIIALFDNDAVGVREFNLLKKLKLPSNITVTTLPDIELAKNYPTIGPTGNSLNNVNGKATSLEMFLGSDILLNKQNNKLEPVVWGGYVDEKVGYQGEIRNKREIQEKFREKVKNVKNSNKKKGDWSGLTLVWEHIFNIYS